MRLDVPLWAWAVLVALMISLIAIDLLIHRGDHEGTRRGAVIWTVVWIAAALVFNLFVLWRFGRQPAEEFLGAYLLEKSLSLDNLFVFIVIFDALEIPRNEQRRVLIWGILGALVMRALFIFAGAAMLERWHFVSYAFGAILVVTAIRIALPETTEKSGTRLLGWLERHLPWSKQLHDHRFFARVDGRLLATPLLLALIAIELTDVVFAIDSVPAAFAVTREPFIVYSSNVFAILGLRALYIVLAQTLVQLRYLKYGLAAVLAFAGVKLALTDVIDVPPLLAVAVIVVCIGTAAIASVIVTRRQREALA